MKLANLKCCCRQFRRRITEESQGITEHEFEQEDQGFEVEILGLCAAISYHKKFSVKEHSGKERDLKNY